MAIDPVGLDMEVTSKNLNKPAKTCTVVADVYWNGVKRATVTMLLDANGRAKANSDFAYAFTCIPEP